jgi:hypothetical protein
VVVRVVFSDVVCGDLHAPRHYTQHVHPPYSIDYSSIEHLSEGIGTLLENANGMPKLKLPYIINKLNE